MGSKRMCNIFYIQIMENMCSIFWSANIFAIVLHVLLPCHALHDGDCSRRRHVMLHTSYSVFIACHLHLRMQARLDYLQSCRDS